MSRDDDSGAFHGGRVAAGFIVLALGTMLLLDRNGMLGGHVMRYFGGVALIALGLARLAGVRAGCSRGAGFVGAFWLAFVGVWLIASQAEWWGLTFHTSWPLLVIASGVVIVARELFPGLRECRRDGPRGVQES